MRSSCISYPEKEPIVVIRKSQVDFCNGNTCAAALFSFFEYWHNIKLDMQPKNAAMNKVSEMHGDIGYQDESLLQFHSMTELSEGIMGLYGVSSIKEARKLLVKLGVITEHKNPSDRYKFDHTIYYLFHPEIFSKWLNYRFVIFNQSSVEINDRSVEINGTITETTTEITSETTTERKDIGAIAPKAAKEKIVEPKKQTATRLPVDWKPSLDDVLFCTEKRPDLLVTDVADEFRDYWISVPGTKGKKEDWSATWRNWVRRSFAKPTRNYSQTGNNNATNTATGRKLSLVEQGQLSIDRIEARELRDRQDQARVVN